MNVPLRFFTFSVLLFACCFSASAPPLQPPLRPTVGDDTRLGWSGDQGVSGNLTVVSNIVTLGNVSAVRFLGDGSQLAGLNTRTNLQLFRAGGVNAPLRISNDGSAGAYSLAANGILSLLDNSTNPGAAVLLGPAGWSLERLASDGTGGFTNALVATLGTNGTLTAAAFVGDGSGLAGVAKTNANYFNGDQALAPGFRFILGPSSGAIGGSVYFSQITGPASSRNWMLHDDDQALGDFVISVATAQNTLPTVPMLRLDSAALRSYLTNLVLSVAGTAGAPTNTTTPAAWMPVTFNGTNGYVPFYH